MFAAIVCIAASLFGRVTIGDQAQVVVSFGLFCCSLFSIAYIIFAGAAIFAKEISRRTIITLLAKPIARYQVLIGKWLGLSVTATLLATVMSATLALYMGIFFENKTKVIVAAATFFVPEIFCVAALIILFSSIVVTPLFVGCFTFGVFLAGRSASSIQQLTGLVDASSVQFLLSGLHALVPKFEYLYMADRLMAGESAQFDAYISAFSYGLGYSILILCISTLFFSRREFH
jgi:ABC-type transport system involved in multi-copper enzyme maturation permease subunit